MLTQGGTVADTSAEISTDGKAGFEVSIDVDYSNHALSGTGLQVFILRDIDETVFEADGDGSFGFEMPFTQNGTHRRAFAVLPSEVSKFKILLKWSNATASSVATIATATRAATIPVAS